MCGCIWEFISFSLIVSKRCKTQFVHNIKYFVYNNNQGYKEANLNMYIFVFIKHS